MTTLQGFSTNPYTKSDRYGLTGKAIHTLLRGCIIRFVKMTGATNAMVSTEYYSYGNYTLTLPDPTTLELGSMIRHRQIAGTGTIVCGDNTQSVTASEATNAYVSLFTVIQNSSNVNIWDMLIVPNYDAMISDIATLLSSHAVDPEAHSALFDDIRNALADAGSIAKFTLGDATYGQLPEISAANDGKVVVIVVRAASTDIYLKPYTGQRFMDHTADYVLYPSDTSEGIRDIFLIADYNGGTNPSWLVLGGANTWEVYGALPAGKTAVSITL